MPLQSIDAVGHLVTSAGPNLVASAVSTTTTGTIAGTTSAGAAPTIAVAAGQVCTDRAGVFTLTPVTGGGAQAAGAVATVRFTQEYPTVPAITVSLSNTTANPNVPILVGTSAVTTAGFSVQVAGALTTATNYQVTYTVDAINPR